MKYILIVLFLLYSIFTLNYSQDEDEHSSLIRSMIELQNKLKKNYRLSDTTKPLSYDIHIITDIHRGVFNFSGDVKIHLKVLSSTDSIIINAKDLHSFEIKLKSLKNDTFELSSLKYSHNEETELLTIYCENETLQSDEEYILDISYKGELKDDKSGFFREYYRNWQDEKIWIAATQFEATDARHAFPCYDEPAFKAKFSLSITHGGNYTAISNMPISSTIKVNKNLITTKFEETPLMSTYLIAFVISNFRNISNISRNNFVQRIFSRPEVISDCNFALDTSLKALEIIEEYFNITVDIPKMDHIGIPDMSSLAMENWGLIIYMEDALLTNQMKPDKNVYKTITVITHEYAHQLFGNLVTPKWWTWTWLSEGFATFYGQKLANTIFPEWNLDDYFFIKNGMIALSYDKYDASPMTRYVEKPLEINNKFNWISYQKGCSIITMFESAIGEDTFKKGIQKYLRKFQYSVADEDDLFDALQEAINEDKIQMNVFNNELYSIRTIMGSWTRQPGYPLLTVTRNYENNSFTIHQELYNQRHVPSNTYWWIPLNFASASEPDFDNTTIDIIIPKEQLYNVDENSTGRIIHKDDWIMLNKQQKGYYRINYDKRNWKLIIKALKENPQQFHKYNKIQILEDAYHLFTDNQIDMNIYFDLISYLHNEKDIIVWANIDVLFDSMRLISQIHDKLEIFLQYLIRPVFNEIGYHEKETDRLLMKMYRQKIIHTACIVNLPECIEAAHTDMNNYRKTGLEIDGDKRLYIYCYGMKNATDDDFDYYFNRMISTDCSKEKNRLATALNCSKKRKHAKKLINSILKHDTFKKYTFKEKSDLIEEFRNCITISEILNSIWDFYYEYKNLTSLGYNNPEPTKNPLRSIIIHISYNICTNEHALQLRNFIDQTRKYNILQYKDFDHIEENIATNLDFITKFEKNVHNWFQENLAYQNKSEEINQIESDDDELNLNEILTGKR